MGRLWSEDAKFDAWLKVEVAACEAWAKLKKIPAKDLAIIKKKARFSVPRIEAIEQKTNHDLIAFLTSVAEFVGRNTTIYPPPRGRTAGTIRVAGSE